MAGPRIKSLRILNYRSIGDNWVEVKMPRKAPLALLGENNAGKSNILRAFGLLLGDSWPGSYSPEDHDFFGRNSEGIAIRIHLEVEGLHCSRCMADGQISPVKQFIWKFAKDDDKPCEFGFEASGCRHTYITNEMRQQISCMVVGIDRNLSYQLSYSSKYTTLSKLMKRFHGLLVQDEDRVERLRGFYRSLIDTFYEVEEFQAFADMLSEATSEFGGNLQHGLDIDFSAYDASNYFKSLRVYPHLHGVARAYDELGTGQEQVLAMAFSYAYAKAFGGDGLVLIIEEPESNLHPLAQQWVSKKLYELASTGVQVIYSTHSPYFISLADPGTAVIVRKAGEGEETYVTQMTPDRLVERVVGLGAPSDLVTPSNIGEFYESSSTNDIKAALFSRACVLVEGDTEVSALPILLAGVGTDLVKEGVAVVSVNGLTALSKWIRYFRAQAIPVYPIFDSDSRKKDQPAADAKRARLEILESVGLGDAKDWDQYVDGPIGAHEAFGVFDSDYERAMRTAFGDDYINAEEAARAFVGGSKPHVARFVAKRLVAQTDLSAAAWQPYRDLAERLSKILALAP